MSKKIRRILSLLLVAALMFTGVPALAAEGDGEPVSTAGNIVARRSHLLL